MSPVSTRRALDIANYLSVDAHLFGGNMHAFRTFPAVMETRNSGASETKSSVIKLTQTHCRHILRHSHSTRHATLPVKNHNHNANANPMKVKCTFAFIWPFIFHTRQCALECECCCYNKVWQKNVMCIKM